jgi:hypothetical protein
VAAPGLRAHADGRGYTPATVRAVAEGAIGKAVQSKDNRADLINVALDELMRQCCELPGYTTLDAMASAIRTEVNGGMFTWAAARPTGCSGHDWSGCCWSTRRLGAASSTG